MTRLLKLGISTILFISNYAQNPNSRVKINGNGYSEIVVAFHNHVTEAEGYPLIQKIKELFSSASHALYRATRYRSYFKEVTILVSHFWSKKPEYKTASYEIFTEADIRIDEANPRYGDGPYTVQPTPCGQPARYIHITPNYLKFLNTTSTKTYGDPGKTLTHEWAHFRYGIFDEYPEASIAEFPAFYIDHRTEEVLPNACANAKLVGEEWNPVKNGPCTHQRNGLPEDDCVFLPDQAKNDKVTSSIASYHYLHNVYTFCDDTDQFKHNPRAPNRHNRMCAARSTWEVITSHNDFAKNNNPPHEISDTTPTFKIVQLEYPTFCLVVDISSGINDPLGYFKIAMLKDAASRWIKEEVRLGSNVGVVLFSNGARLAHNIVTVTSDSVKTQLINTIPSTAGGMTCIGCGLNTAMAELARFRNNAPGGIIILLVDGDENVGPYIADVTGSIINANIRVISLAFTAAPNPSLEALAAATHGKVFSIPIQQSVGELGSFFQEVRTYQSIDDGDDKVVKIEEKRFKDLSSVFVGTFTIDATIGRETVVSFLYSDRSDITGITIIRPGWKVTMTNVSGGKFEDIVHRKEMKFTFDDLSAGKYLYQVDRRGSTNQDVTVSVSSKSRVKGGEMVTITCKVEQLIGRNPPEYLITADVRKGTKPVFMADVVSKVELPNGKSEYIDLYDTGRKGDIARDDGIYSGYFTRYNGAGRYSVWASVVSNINTALLESGFVVSKAHPILTKQSNITKIATGYFKRIADADSIEIQHDVNAQDQDLFPPNRITDLKVVEVSADNSYIVLEWSAPGDDLHDGQAQKYQMKYSTNWETLNKNFLGREYYITVRPKPAGEIERLKAFISVLADGVSYYIALKTKDDENQWSALSNIVEMERTGEDTTQAKSIPYGTVRLHDTIDHPLKEYTMCHWTKVNDVTIWGPIFSYNTETQYRAIGTRLREDGLIEFNQNDVILNATQTGEDISSWIHICITSNVPRGKWNVYFNGVKEWIGDSSRNDKTNIIAPFGSVILGQTNLVTNKFLPNHNFKGQIADVFLWDRVLNPEEVSAVYACNPSDEANVINWNLHIWKPFNGVLVSTVKLPCGLKY